MLILEHFFGDIRKRKIARKALNMDSIQEQNCLKIFLPLFLIGLEISLDVLI